MTPEADSAIPAPAEEREAQYRALKAPVPPLRRNVALMENARSNEPAAIERPASSLTAPEYWLTGSSDVPWLKESATMARAVSSPRIFREADAGIYHNMYNCINKYFHFIVNKFLKHGFIFLWDNWVSMAGKGFLISVEGIDGTGKTTQVQLLREWLEHNGRSAVILKEPTQGTYGREIAKLAAEGKLKDPEKELRLFMQDRMEDVHNNIIPTLMSGKVVIMDRYYQSNMAYQGARGLDVEKIREENEKFSPVPDLIIILDIDPEKSMARVKTRKNVIDHFENEKYLEKVREIFLTIGKGPNAVVIDAGVPIEEVHKRIVEAIKERLHILE